MNISPELIFYNPMRVITFLHLKKRKTVIIIRAFLTSNILLFHCVPRLAIKE